MLKSLSLRAQILWMLSLSIVVAGLLSFRSTITFLRNDKVSSLRELQTLSVGSVVTTMREEVETLRAELRTQIFSHYQSPDQVGKELLNVVDSQKRVWSKLILRRLESTSIATASTSTSTPASLLFDPSPSSNPPVEASSDHQWSFAFEAEASQIHFKDFLILKEGREIYAIEGWTEAPAIKQAVLAGALESVRFDLYSLLPQSTKLGSRIFGNTVNPDAATGVEEFLSGIEFSDEAIQAQSKTYESAGETHFVSWGAVTWPGSSSRFLVSVSSQESQLLAAFRSFIVEQVYLLLLVLLATLYAGFAISGLITKPVEALVGAVALIESGDFSARVEVRGASELGRLGSAFNNMGQALKEREEALEKSEGNVRKLSFHSEFMNRLNGFADITSRTLDLSKLEAQVSELWFETVGVNPEHNSMALYRFDKSNQNFVRAGMAGQALEWEPSLSGDADAAISTGTLHAYTEGYWALSIQAESDLRYLLIFSTDGM